MNSVCNWDTWHQSSVSNLESVNLLRSLRPVCTSAKSPAEVYISDDTRNAWLNDVSSTGELIDEGNQVGSGYINWHHVRLFSTNDYLGLSTHPNVVKASIEALHKEGMGPRSSALVAGYTHLHRKLESALAALKGTEECLLFPTGFAANTAVMATLGSPTPESSVEIFSDELNHASIVDGARLAKTQGAKIHVYRHLDVSHLAALLEKSLRDSGPSCRRIVVTDTLFSMDGDLAPLTAISRLKSRVPFLLVVDDAHATLVFQQDALSGQKGGGKASSVVGEGVDVYVGTLSKAVGTLGGFACCARVMKKMLLTRGRPFVYSTALPAPLVAGALAALSLLDSQPAIRSYLWYRVKQLGDALGYTLQSPIVPILVGDAHQALELSKDLLRRGFHVPAIRPPTVPVGSSRLRIALSAAHSEEDVRMLIQALQETGVIELSRVINRKNGDIVAVDQINSSSSVKSAMIRSAL